MAIIEEKNPKKWTKDGRKFYFDTYYIDSYGNRKEKKSRMYKNRKLAKEAEVEFLNKIKTTDLTDKNVSFVNAYNEWLAYKSQSIKPTTFYGIETKCNKYMLQYFKDYKLHNIKIKNIYDWKELLNSKSIKLRTKNSCITYFEEFLKFAITNFDFDKKVAAKLQKFRDDAPKNAKTDAEINFLTLEEFTRFIEVVDDEYYYLIFEFFYSTGVRLGEFLAITWEDIDFSSKTLKITKSLTTKVNAKYKSKDKKYIILSPKTSNSIRIIDLDDNLIELLKHHYEHEKKLYSFNDKMFVFGNVKPIAVTTLRRKLNYYIDIAEVKKITIHGFRHSHVSLLIHLNCDVQEVAQRMGDTVEMILKTYCHMFPEKKKHTINVINNLKKNLKNTR